MISILTCTFNRPSLLQAALASVRAQTRTDWEHLVADNGSTNRDVKNLLETVADPRVHVFPYPENVDQPARRWNDLIDRASGEYLCLLDDDGEKDPRYLEVMAGALDSDPSLDAVTCGFRMVREDGSVEENHLNLRTAEEIATRSTVDTGCFLIRRSALDKIGYFPLDIKTNEDWALMRRAAAVLKMEHLPHCLATWREHGGQRLRRARDLGTERDKIHILREPPWRAECIVRVYHPPAIRLLPAQTAAVASILGAARSTPWISSEENGRPPDLAVLLCPALSGGLGPEPPPVFPTSRSTLALHREDPKGLPANVDRLRHLAIMRDDVWALTNDPGSMDAYREIVGERVILCGDTEKRFARAVNAVRSKRYEAEIP